ncbi:MAG: hypothetical protein BECKG1743D_GA0114223_103581 [Candidatus Kentron sp. G]|nr:MAG: hypothetical protein BECKG1743E_GA0114224_101901 [Candidatus Kentron sp. G]VFN02355.1 MAG: hypothetical protein BECKG1743D_GA0114223_103581 [Candidatus Kentron sp. G]
MLINAWLKTVKLQYTNLLVFIVQFLRCNNSYIVNDAPAARLESERKSCAIRYILFCQSPNRNFKLSHYLEISTRNPIRA